MTHNAEGLRMTRQTSSERTTFVWDGSDYLGEESS